MYGSQVTNQPDFLSGSRFGSGQIGYGPGGQHYDPSNPVVMTTSGVRPASVVNQVKQPTMAAYGPGISFNAPNAFTKTGGVYDQRRNDQVAAQRLGSAYGTAGTPTGQSGSVFGGPAGTSPVGIGSGGSVPGAIQGAQARLLYGQAPGVPVSGAAQGEINQQFGDVFGRAQNTANLDLLRRGAFEGANLNLDRAKAQAAANVDWQNLIARLREQLDNQNQFGINALYGIGG